MLQCVCNKTELVLYLAGHSFCSGCASKSLAISDRCPFCRRSHNPSQVANQVKPYAHTASSGTHAVQDILDDVEASSQLSARARSPSARLPLGEDHSSTLTGSLWPRDTTGLAWGRQSLIDVIPARSEVQDSIQTLIARIESLNFRPGTAWDAQLSELRVIDLRLSLGLQEGQPNMRHFFQEVQEHTASVAADFAEYMRRREERQQLEQRQQIVQHEAHQRRQHFHQYRQQLQQRQQILQHDAHQRRLHFHQHQQHDDLELAACVAMMRQLTWALLQM